MKAAILNSTLYQDDACDSLTLPASDRGFLLGDGLFETLPVLNDQPLWWSGHKTRLTRSAELIGLPLDMELLDQTVARLSAVSNGESAILRIAVSRGAGGRGLLPPDEPKPTLLATLTPLPAGLAFADVTLATSTIRRNEHSVTARLKSNNYLDNILAAREAEKSGAGDALLLNSAGNAACTTIGNLFTLKGNRLTTPPVADGVLPGILRGQLLALASRWGFECREASIDLQALKKADGLVMTNSLRFIRRVTELDGHRFNSTPDDRIAHLQSRLRQHVATLTGTAP
nr:aminotransferase class IV [uncultured Cohaesibacter sp.]